MNDNYLKILIFGIDQHSNNIIQLCKAVQHGVFFGTQEREMTFCLFSDFF